MRAIRERLRESAAAFRQAFGNRGLRRLQLGGAASTSGSWAYNVALAVYAYEAGGAKAVGLIGLIRTIPAAVAAPFVSVLADRLPRVSVMAASEYVRAAAVGVAGALALSHGSEWIVYALAGVGSIVGTAFLPAESAVLPELARTPEELTAANVTRSTVESVSSFVGPAIGGILLAATSPGVVFLAAAGTFVCGGLVISLIRVPKQAAGPPVSHPEQGARRFTLEATAGFRTIARERSLRVVVALFAAQTFVAGALGVLVVVTALRLLEKGEATVGYLSAAEGVGGIAGAVVAFGLVGRNRLASDFGAGIVLWGAPLVLIGVWPNTAVALLAFAVVGLGNTLVDVAGLTLMQRTAPADVVGRVFGVLQTVLVGTIGLGAILTPLLIDAIGIRWSLVATGAFLPALAALTWHRLLTIDAASAAPTEGIVLLEGIPIFAPLPTPSLERLAAQLELLAVPAGATVIRQGDPGDRFYVVESGRLSVTVGGARSRELGAGDFFGEIALLRDVPRTATVVAETKARLHTLGRDDFLAAVTGYAPSARAADAVVGAHLSARPAETAASP
jgi:MFS family permease